MEMQQVLYFRALCEELNFTRAARRCKVAQPSLTRSIRLLEEEFGGRPRARRCPSPGWPRPTRPIDPESANGCARRPCATSTYRYCPCSGRTEQANAVAEQARGFRQQGTTRLKLGIMCTVAPADLIHLLSTVRNRHPGIQLEVVDAMAEQISADLRRGDREVAILSKPAEDQEPFLRYLPLFREQFMVVLHRDNWLARHETVRVDDLKGVPYLFRVHCGYADEVGRVFAERGANHETVYRSDRDDWILAMAAAGMGYAFLPEHCVNHPHVVARPLVEPDFWREVCLVTVRGRPHSPAVGALVHEAMRGSWANNRALAVKEWRRNSSG